MSEALSGFQARWLARLNQGAQTRFHNGLTPGGAGLHSSVADGFVNSLGYSPIGYDWELLDPAGEESAPRSAMGELTSAIANRISNPSLEWLGSQLARQCAGEFLACFDPATRTVVSNRYDGLWNPISGAAVEWAFLAFDDKHIALLLISEP